MKASCRGASKPFLVCRSKELALRTISFHRLSLVVAASAALMMPGSNLDAQPAAPTVPNPISPSTVVSGLTQPFGMAFLRT
jgi:hypothetical protein